MPSFGVSVAAIEDGRVLLHLREDARLWSLPGGAVDAGETLAQAAVREVREETGLEVRLTRLVGVYSRPRWRNGGDHQVLFAATPSGESLAAFDPAETVEVGYFSPDALPDLTLWWQRRMIADSLAGAAATAWSLDAIWPFDEDRRALVDRFRRDPAFAASVQATFTTMPARDAEHRDV